MPVRTTAWIAILAIAFALTSWVGLRTALLPTHLSVVWPSAALAVAAVLTWGRKAWLGVWILAFALALWIATSPTGLTPAIVGIAANIALGCTIQAAITAYLFKRFIPAGLFATASSVVRLAGLAAVGCVFAPTWSAGTLLLGGTSTAETYLNDWARWWLGDLTSVIVFMPLLMQWREMLRVSKRRGWIAEAIGTCAAMVLMGALVYFGWDKVSKPQYFLAFAILPSVVWIALRFRPPGVALSAAFVSAMAYAAVNPGAEVEQVLTPEQRLLFQIFCALVAITGLVLSAAIAAQKRAETLLRSEKARYVDLYENSPDMLASVDVDSGLITECNQTLATLLGLTKEQIVGRPVLDVYEPESREIARRAFDSFRLTGHGGFTELSLIRRNGHKLEVSLSASAVRDASGRIVSSRTAWRDVSARKLAERALNESQQIWRAFIEQAPAAIAMFDKKMRYLAVSKRFLSDSGFAPDREMYGASQYDVFPNMPEHWKEAHRRALAGEVVTGDEDRFETADGRVQWLHWEVRPWYDVGGLAGVVLFTEDISPRKQATDELLKLNAELEARVEERTAELERLAREMEERSLTDQLTGLPNRRALDQKLAVDLLLALRHNVPLTLLMLDVDHFKQYNDSFGHPAGDEVLRTVAHVLKLSLRTTDFAARWGGEEFAVLLEHTAADGAAVVAERIRLAIEALTWPHRAVTVSIGAATLCCDTKDVAGLLAEADAALYEAKRLGRNRVVSASATHEDHGQDQQSA